jgi:hypothetical protein
MKAARWSFALGAGLLLAAAPGISSAQGWRGTEPREQLAPYGVYVLLGGGVTDFADEDVKDRFDVGGTWDARVGIGNRFYVGGELAYVGSALKAIGSGSDLVTNGAEAVLRLQYPITNGSWLVEPFAFGGIGWSHLSVQDAAPGVDDSDDAGVVPFGAGLTVGYDRLLLDARFTYRTSFDEDLALAVGDGPASLERWAVSGSVGYAF